MPIILEVNKHEVTFVVAAGLFGFLSGWYNNAYWNNNQNVHLQNIWWYEDMNTIGPILTLQDMHSYAIHEMWPTNLWKQCKIKPQ